MILSIIVILLVLAIAFIHFIQGFFSSAISAILVMISAIVAVGYQESLVNMMKPGKFADDATATIICVLFVVTYLILRVIFDKAIPGNVRLLPTVDKIGAAVMGLIAGVFAAGVIAIAMQSMPFYSGSLQARYATAGERDAGGTYKPNDSQVDRKLMDQVRKPTFEPAEVSKLIIPADDWTLGVVSSVSSGSLAGQVKFADIHPDYLQELYGQRAGVQPGSKHTANNFPGGGDQVTFEAARFLTKGRQLAAQDAGLDAVRKSEKEPTKALSPEVADKPMLILRVKVSNDAIDTSNVFSFSPASVRLVIHPDGGPAQNLFPVGTLEGGKLWLNRIDDYMFSVGDASIDFAFPLEKLEDALDETPDPKTKQRAFKPGTFIEVKRLARIDLSDKSAAPGAPAAITGNGVLRPAILKPVPKT